MILLMSLSVFVGIEVLAFCEITLAGTSVNDQNATTVSIYIISYFKQSQKLT